MNFEQEFHAQFGEKYDNLQLKEVVVSKTQEVCTITFLYPSTSKELKDAEKNEIIDWLKNSINLEKIEIKVKFMKAFLEERLIMKAIQSYFEKKYKLITTYLSENNFKIKITPIDVLIDIELSGRMMTFFIENKIPAEFARHLKDNFLVEFVINLKEDASFVDEVDIENVEIKTKYVPVQRYSVEIVKEVIGKGITPKPEFLSFINGQKESVIVAGFLGKIERKDFVVKNGKQAGNTKSFFTFQLSDRKGRIECIYFCPKRNEKVMDALEEHMYVLLHGDVRLNKMNKLCLYIDKIALANEVAKEEVSEKKQNVVEQNGPVVVSEKIVSTQQDSIFEQKCKYNKKIVERTIVVFDLETTGLNPMSDEITEIGAVKIENGNIVEKFCTFVKINRKLSYEVIETTGITDEMLENAPPVELVLRDFYEFCKGCVLSGHNAIGFDIKFVRREAEKIGLVFDNEIIDTYHEALASKLKLSNFKLGTVVKALGFTLEGAHRAWNDAYATAQVLLKLNEIQI